MNGIILQSSLTQMTMNGKISSRDGVLSFGSRMDVNTADDKDEPSLQYQNGEKGRDYPNGIKHLPTNGIDVNVTSHNIVQPPPSTPILIIGGGPVGLLAAILLAKRGIPSTVLERHASRLGQPKAHAINPRSLELFRQAGLDTEYLRKLGARPQDAGAVRFVVSIKGLEFGMLPYERQDEGVRSLTPEPLFNIAQPILEQYLWGVALETGLVTIWRQWQWQSCVEVDDNTISSTVLDRETNHEIRITSKYLLGCDGAHARSRAQFQIPFDTLDGRPSTPIHYVSVNFNADMSKAKTGALWFIMTKTAGKRNFIAYDRSCNWVFVTTYDPKLTPHETFTEENCRSLIDQVSCNKIQLFGYEF
jgi:2,4-dichlorophenol 6-monooxygenase